MKARRFLLHHVYWKWDEGKTGSAEAACLLITLPWTSKEALKQGSSAGAWAAGAAASAMSHALGPLALCTLTA